MRIDFDLQFANPFGRNLNVRRGMGGIGSGGANRKRPHFEGLRRINVGYLVQHGMDRPGTYSNHSWRDNWQRPTGSMQIVGGGEVVTLVYSVRNGAAYASSQEGPTDRAMRRANTLKRRLGAEPGLDSFYWRPKHMRQRTFDAIDARIQAAEAEVNDAHIRLLGRLSGMGRRQSGQRRVGKRSAARAFW